MSTLSMIKANVAGGPYLKPLKVKIVEISEPFPFTVGIEIKYRYRIAVADETDAMLITCYKESVMANIVAGRSVMIMGYQRRSNTELVLQDREGVSVLRTSSVTIREETNEKARAMICPDSSAMTMSSITSKTTGFLTIEGTLTIDALGTEVTIIKTGKKASVRNIQLTDIKDQSMKIALWRSAADCVIKMGDYIKMTHMTAKTYMQEISLQSSGYTKIQEIQRLCRNYFGAAHHHPAHFGGM